jgi:transposase
MLKKFEISRKTVAEQSISSQTRLGSVMEGEEILTGNVNINDNAAAHTLVKTREFVTKKNMVIVPYPAYSPDLAPCDFAVAN